MATKRPEEGRRRPPARRRLHDVKFPEVLRYANAHEEFMSPSEAHIAWAWGLVNPLEPALADRGYTPGHVWEELRDHQAELRAFLDEIRIDRPQHTPVPDLSASRRAEEGGFVVVPIRLRWSQTIAGSIRDNVRSFADFDRRLAQRHAADRRLAADGVPEAALHGTQTPAPPSALDVLYMQLNSRLKGKGTERLRKCLHCEDFFFAVTARTQRYCADTCRRQAHTARESSGDGVRRFRAERERQDREQVRAAVDKVRRDGTKQVVLEEVWPEYTPAPKYPMGRRRFKRLLKLEIGDDLLC
jgi:hypothetical protein